LANKKQYLPALLGTSVTDPRLPRYLKIRDSVARSIARSEWKSGEAIPTESQLASKHQVSVGTVRKAMDMLVAEGLVDRVHGKGTFVRPQEFATPLFRFFNHLSHNGAVLMPDGHILQRRALVPSEEVRNALELKPNEVGIETKRVRTRDSQIVLAQDIWVSAARFEGILDIPIAEFEPLFYPIYQTRFRIVIDHVEEKLSVKTDAEMAKMLGVLPDTMLMEIKRIAFAKDNRPVEWRRSCCSAAGFQYKVVVR
jgi:GntR family transcriptional regulator